MKKDKPVAHIAEGGRAHLLEDRLRGCRRRSRWLLGGDEGYSGVFQVSGEGGEGLLRTI